MHVISLHFTFLIVSLFACSNLLAVYELQFANALVHTPTRAKNPDLKERVLHFEVRQGQPGQDEGVLPHLPGPHLPPPEGEGGQEAAHIGGKSRGGAEDATEVSHIYIEKQKKMERLFPGALQLQTSRRGSGAT